MNSPFKPGASNLILPVALCVLIILAICYAIFVGREWDRHDAQVRAANEAMDARTRELQLTAEARRFLDRVDEKRNDIIPVRLDSELSLPTGRETGQVVTLHATEGGQSCMMVAEAIADLSSELIWMRPRQLVCNGISRPVSGTVRTSDGRLLVAKVTDVSLTGWPRLFLPPSVLQAWITKS